MKALEILKDREQILDCKLKERIEKSYNKQYEDDNQITRAILDELNFLDKMIKELEDLENRTCENCKHFKPITRNKKYYRRCFFLGSIDLQYCSAFENKQ
jgi:hypothetical protein